MSDLHYAMTYTITRGPAGNEIEIDVEVEFSVTPASRGRRDSLGGRANAGPPLEPDCPAEIKILSVREVVSGREVEDLSAEEIADITEKAWEHLADCEADYPEPDDR